MNKKNYLFVTVVLLIITLGIFSCSQNDDVVNSATPDLPQTRSLQQGVKTQKEANYILVNYLELVDNKYILTISQAEAEKLGVPSFLYKGAQNEISETNALTEKLMNDPNITHRLTDPKVALKKKLKNRQAGIYPLSAPNGTLNASNQTEVQHSHIWAPMGTEGIRFTCISYTVLTPTFICKTYSSATWKAKSATGVMGQNEVIEVPLYVSNDYIGVAFQTTDSNGGVAAYEGYP